MYRPENRYAPPADPETRQRELVDSYQEALRSFVSDRDEAMRQATDVHTAGVDGWAQEGIGQRKFERVLKGTTEDMQELTDLTASSIEGLLAEMHDRVLGTLSADDRKVLQEAMRAAHEHGASSYKVSNALHRGSSYAAQNALDAAMDGTRLRHARKVAKEEGASSYKVDNVIHSGSSYAAQNALDAALDGDRFKHAKRLAKEHGAGDYRVGNVFHSASVYRVGEAMGIAINIEDISIPKMARKLGRQVFKNIFSRSERTEDKGRTEPEDEIPDYEDLFEEFFKRGFGREGFGGAHSHSGQQHAGGSHSEGRTYEAPPPPPRSDEPNPYEVLGVARDASQQDIKRAYRDLARQHHPDMNEGRKPDEEAMKRINNAYDLLGKPETREYFDKHGHTRGM